jgi:hypothetical protein
VSSTVSAPVTRKTVLILGRSAVGLALPSSTPITGDIVVLVIGWPLTDQHRAVLKDAEAAARTARVRFDAHLLASARQIGPLVDAADRMLLDARPREARRIRRALERR